MTEELVACREDQDVNEAARMREDKQIRRLPVLNRDQQLVGIVLLGDLAVQARQAAAADQGLRKVSQPLS